MDTDKKARELMEEGWKTREDLDFDQAEKLLNEAKGLFTKNEDWFNVTECLTHLAYTKKLRATKILDEGVDLVSEAESIQHQKQTKGLLVLRAKMSLFEAKGYFEYALNIAKKMLEMTDKSNNKADILIHISYFNLRTGFIDLAENSLAEAEKFMSECWDNERDPHKSIWKTKMLIQKGLILYSRGKYVEARKTGQDALELAKEKDLKTRLKQAEDFLRFAEAKI